MEVLGRLFWPSLLECVSLLYRECGRGELHDSSCQTQGLKALQASEDIVPTLYPDFGSLLTCLKGALSRTSLLVKSYVLVWCSIASSRGFHTPLSYLGPHCDLLFLSEFQPLQTWAHCPVFHLLPSQYPYSCPVALLQPLLCGTPPPSRLACALSGLGHRLSRIQDLLLKWPWVWMAPRGPVLRKTLYFLLL